MSRLCLDDRVLLIELNLTSNKSVTEAIRKFCTTKRIKKVAEKPSRSTVYALIRKFQMTGNVADLDRSGRPTLQDIRSPVVEELVDESHGRISTSKISRISNISQSSVHRILTNQLKLHPYRIQVVHSLSDRDKENRVTFANEMLNRISEDPTLVQNILWTDEAHFCLSAEVNFSELKVISRGFACSRPARSPDLNGCDFWLCGHLKASVYTHPYPSDRTELKERIRLHMRKIPQSMLQATVESFVHRLKLCVERDGGHLI